MLHDPNKLAEFEAENEVDFSYSMEGLARFRVNAFFQRGTVSVVMRAIPVNIKSVEELNLPSVISRLAEEERGIILLTGTTGSGKSTTLAAMIDHMNRTMHKHIVTIEDPIEFLHRDRNSIINQREVGQDTASFKRALRRVLRQDPDVILVGEMRDEETVHTALSAAETGHLVLSTLHTVDAPETINRIIDFFPPHQQQQARAMIAGTLKGIISQRLVPTADGKGRVATCEIMVMTGRVHDMIIDPKQTGHARRGRGRGRLLRHADLRPAPAGAPERRADHDGGRHARRLLAARLQADGRGAGADLPALAPEQGRQARSPARPRTRAQVAPVPTDAPPAAPAPAVPAAEQAPAVPPVAPRRLRRRRLRRPPGRAARRDAAAASPGRPAGAVGRPADSVGAASRHPVLIA